MKLPKLFKRKSSDDDEDDEEDDFEGGLGDEDGDSDAAAAGGGDDDDDDDWEDDEDDGEGKGGRKPLIIIAAGASVLVAGIIGGAGWWYFSGDEEPEKTAAAVEQTSSRTKVQLAMPPKAGSRKALLTPPPGAAAPGLNQLRGAAPRETAPTALGAAPARGPSPDAGRPAGQAPGQAPAPAAGRTVGNIGGRFGGQADPLGGSLNAAGAAPRGKETGIVVPAMTSTSFRTLPDRARVEQLSTALDAKLIEKKEGLEGPLPIIGKDGSMPWQVYARPYEADDDFPRVAIMITGLGLSRAATMAAIKKLPPEVTLVLDPYAKDLKDWWVRARLSGHEVLVALPMESERFPVYDGGPLSLDTGLKAEENLKRLEMVLSRFGGYIGVATVLGSRFGTSESMLKPILEAIKARGLMLVATGVQRSLRAPKMASAIGLPRVVSNLTLDEEPSRAAIDAQLARLEEIIRDQSMGVATAHAFPATIERLIAWTASLKGKKLALVPVSALADKQILE